MNLINRIPEGTRTKMGLNVITKKNGTHYWFIRLPVWVKRKTAYNVSEDALVYGLWVFNIAISPMIDGSKGIRIIWEWSLSKEYKKYTQKDGLCEIYDRYFSLKDKS